MKQILVLVGLILIILPLTSFNEINETFESSEELNRLLRELGYSEQDQANLYARFSQVEIEHIIDRNITKDRLFPYLNHPYVNVYRFDDYEAIKELSNLTHFESINYTHYPISLRFDSDNNTNEGPAPLKHTSLVLVNKQFYLDPDEIPSDLVFMQELNLVIPGPLERNYLKAEAYNALKGLFQAADANGYTLYVLSAYRSYLRQQTIYQELLHEDEANAMLSAKPGHSEHQTGLSVDITARSVDYRLIPSFEQTPEGQFILNHAHKYGFIIRYPKNKEQITGYLYNPGTYGMSVWKQRHSFIRPDLH